MFMLLIYNMYIGNTPFLLIHHNHFLFLRERYDISTFSSAISSICAYECRAINANGGELYQASWPSSALCMPSSSGLKLSLTSGGMYMCVPLSVSQPLLPPAAPTYPSAPGENIHDMYGVSGSLLQYLSLEVYLFV